MTDSLSSITKSAAKGSYLNRYFWTADGHKFVVWVVAR